MTNMRLCWTRDDNYLIDSSFDHYGIACNLVALPKHRPKSSVTCTDCAAPIRQRACVDASIYTTATPQAIKQRCETCDETNRRAIQARQRRNARNKKRQSAAVAG